MLYRNISEMSGKVLLVKKIREFVGTISGNLQSLEEHLFSRKSGVCRAQRLKSSSLGGVY